MFVCVCVCEGVSENNCRPAPAGGEHLGLSGWRKAGDASGNACDDIGAVREGTEPQPASLPDALREVPPLGCPFKTRVTDRGGGQGTSRRAGEGEARPPAWTAPRVPVRV